MITTTFMVFCAVASVIGAFLPVENKKSRLIHALYGLIIALLALAVLRYEYRINKINKVELAARTLADKRDPDFTDLGFIQATLTFLEKYKDLYPDTYERALRLCEENECFKSENKKEDLGELEHAWSLIDVSFAMQGILRGISEINKEER